MFKRGLLLIGTILCNALVKEEVAVGIDLGTTFCCVSVFKPSEKTTAFVDLDMGNVFPSVVYYTKSTDENNNVNYTPVSGKAGLQLYKVEKDASRFFYAFKRGMGLGELTDIDTKVSKLRSNVSYPIVEKVIDGKKKIAFQIVENGSIKLDVTPEELSSYVLYKLKEFIERDYIIKHLVVTVPAYFNSNQKTATADAAIAAGLPEPKIRAEPVAAAFAYQVDIKKTTLDVNEKVCVFDLGGGTLDISVVEAEDQLLIANKYAGDNYCGGENVNDNITQYFAVDILQRTGYDVLSSQDDKLRLRNEVEEIKKKLCNLVNESPIKIGHSVTSDFLYNGTDAISLSLTIEQFDDLNASFYNKIRNVMIGAESGLFRNHEDAIDPKSISKVLLVGGSTRIPYVIKMVTDIFGDDKIVKSGIDADTIVARGASLLAAAAENLLDESSQVHLIDSVSLPLGICVNEDTFESIVAEGSFIPASGSKNFTTAENNQKKVMIKVAQGFRASFKLNNYLGEFELTLQGNQLRGEPVIEVTMKMNSDGGIEVEAVDKATNNKKNVRFDPAVARIDPVKFKKMQEDAKANAAKDEELRAKWDMEQKLRTAQDGARAQADSIGGSAASEIKALITAVDEWKERYKDTATKFDYENKLNSFNESVKSIIESAKPQAKTDEPEQKAPEPEKEAAREEL